MKCEICHNAEAEKVLRKTIEGKPCELYVCKNCANEAEASDTPDDPPGKKRITLKLTPEQIREIREVAVPLTQAVAKRLFEMSGQDLSAMMGKPSDPVVSNPEYGPNSMSVSDDSVICPNCNLSLSGFLSSGRVGCAECYDFFARGILPMVQACHKGFVHIGKRPPQRKSSPPGGENGSAS